MKKILGIIIFGLLWCSSSLALSPDRERIEHKSCFDGMISQGNSKSYANKFCTCSVNMISKKYSDKKLDKIISKGWDYMMKKIKFAGDHCKKNVLNIRNVPIKINCYMHNNTLLPMTFTLLPDDKVFLSDENIPGNYREINSWYMGAYKFDKFYIEWKINRNNGGIIYQVSKEGESASYTGDCELSTGTKF